VSKSFDLKQVITKWQGEFSKFQRDS